jgi:uncharacterized protein YndB with AHSA1/START domain
MVAVTLTVDMPISGVFDYFTDFRNENEWNVVAHDVVKVTDGEVGVGSTFRGVYDRMGPMRYTVREYEPTHFASVDGEARLFAWHSTFTFTEQPVGTRVVCTMDPRPKGPLRLVKPLMSGMIEKQMHRGLASLKETLEAETRTT